MKSIIISGVGGQGVLTASDLLSDVLLDSGYDVKKSEVHGMSQRGGDVISTIRFGEKVFSPIPSLYETDYILSFEKLEALRNINYLSKDGTMMVNDYAWDPLPVAAGFDKYPENIEETLKKYASRVIMLPATDIAGKLGNIRATNVVLIGTLAANMDIDKDTWLKIVKKKVPPRFIDLNLEAFEKGYSYKI
ncbi:MAG: indolepyruvate oxidoreductase subunit beta [bacterium]|nr:indolepyruvate oxidoreductase subunit beta [bacterium]